jgi:CBS domain containing-hemolysin-like protein
VCITIAALAAGLTMGMLSLDKTDLQVLLATDTKDPALSKVEAQEISEDQGYATVVLPALENRHLLLVTLLLMNSVANEALPLFLDKVVPNPIYALLLSVTFVLVFGEILPSAILTGPNQLYFAAKFVPMVRVLKKVFYPIAYPIARLLDVMVGEEEEDDNFNRAEVKALVNYLQREDALQNDEVNLVHGAVSLHVVEVGYITLSMEKVYMVEMDTILDDEWVAQAMATGHSRVLVYDTDPHNIRGVLLVKRLLQYDPAEKSRVRDLFGAEEFFMNEEISVQSPSSTSPYLASPASQATATFGRADSRASAAISVADSYLSKDQRSFTRPHVRPCVVAHPEDSLADLLMQFMEKRTHVAVVCSDPERVKKAWRDREEIPASIHMRGCAFLEDILEAILKRDISDEREVQKKHAERMRWARVREMVIAKAREEKAASA